MLQRSKNIARKLKRLLKKRKFYRLNKKIQKYSKYSLICFIAKSPSKIDETNVKLLDLFYMCLEQAFYVIVKIMKVLGIWGKKLSTSLMDRIMNHPWIMFSMAYTSLALLILYRLRKKYEQRLRWYHYLLVSILSLLIIYLMFLILQTDTSKRIVQILKRGLEIIVLTLGNINSLFDEYIKDFQAEPIKETSKYSKKDNFKNFILFSILIGITTKYLLVNYKRRLVNQGPLTDTIIQFVDDDPLHLDDLYKFYKKYKNRLSTSS